MRDMTDPTLDSTLGNGKNMSRKWSLNEIRIGLEYVWVSEGLITFFSSSLFFSILFAVWAVAESRFNIIIITVEYISHHRIIVARSLLAPRTGCCLFYFLNIVFGLVCDVAVEKFFSSQPKHHHKKCLHSRWSLRETVDWCCASFFWKFSHFSFETAICIVQEIAELLLNILDLGRLERICSRDNVMIE